MPVPPTLGQHIRALRQDRNLTLRDVSEASVVSVGFLNDIEHDRTRPSLITLVRIATALDMTAIDVLAGIPPYDHGKE